MDELAFGRFQAGIAAGRSTGVHESALGREARSRSSPPRRGTRQRLHEHLGSARPATTCSSCSSVWFSIGVAIVALEQGKWIPTAGAIDADPAVLGFFTVTDDRLRGEARRARDRVLRPEADVRPSSSGSFPYCCSITSGSRLQTAQPRRWSTRSATCPVTVSSAAGSSACSLYAVPILGDPAGAPGERDLRDRRLHRRDPAGLHACTAAPPTCSSTLDVRSGFIFTLMTSGAVWMIGSDRIQAVAAYDGAFPGYFGVFNRRLGTPVRREHPVRCSCATRLQRSRRLELLDSDESTADAFTVVLTIAISTTLISYPLDLPGRALCSGRRYPEVRRPYRVPGRRRPAMLGGSGADHRAGSRSDSGSRSFPGRIEKLDGPSSTTSRGRGACRSPKFEALTLGTLAVVLAIALVGYALGASRSRRPRGRRAARRRGRRALQRPLSDGGPSAGRDRPRAVRELIEREGAALNERTAASRAM